MRSHILCDRIGYAHIWYTYMTDKKNLEPTEIGRQGLTRGKYERTAFDSWVAEQILRGHTVNQLVDLYELEYDRRISGSVVDQSARRLNEEWAITAKEDTSFYYNRELERLDEMERIAWINYRQAGGSVQDVEARDYFSYNEEGESTKRHGLTVVKTRDYSPAAGKWFDRLMKIQTDRRKMLKLETTVNINNIMAVKGYAFFNPGRDWANPVEPPNLPEANVIDAEFSALGENEDDHE